MLQVDNHTPFAPGLAVFPDLDGREAIYLVIRASYDLDGLGPGAEPAEDQPEPELADVYRGDPERTSLAAASEMHVGKAGTDVIVDGCARASGGVLSEVLDVGVRVAERTKVVRVYGDRRWSQGLRGWVPSAPAPFESMALIWERACGGRGPSDPQTGRYEAEARNPVGRGFARGRPEAELLAEPVPNLIDPRAPLDYLGQDLSPAGFAPVAPSWEPRASRAGTYDEAWLKGRAPYLPADFQPAFFNVADPELCFDRFLEGGEPVVLHNLSARGPIQLTLPRIEFEVEVEHTRRWRLDTTLDAKLETVRFDTEAGRLSLSYRAVYSCDKHLLDVETLKISLARLETP